MARSNPYKNYYQSFMTENMNPLYKRYLEYLMEDLPDVSDIGGYFDVPTTAEREGIESLDTEIKTPMAPMNQTRGGGGDGEPRGIGRFQNLDPRSEKMVLVNGVPTKVYRNITSGLLQTFDGKNVKGDVNTQTGAFDYEFDAISPSVETYAADAPPSIFSSKEEDDEDDDEGIAGLSIGDYDYGTFGPNTSAFSRAARVDTAIKQGAVDLAAREAEKKRKAEEAIRKAQEKAAKEEQAKRDAVERMRQQNEREGRGGYQSDFAQDRGFMGGRGGSDEMGSF